MHLKDQCQTEPEGSAEVAETARGDGDDGMRKGTGNGHVNGYGTRCRHLQVCVIRI